MLRLDNVSKRVGAFSLAHLCLNVDHGDYFVLLGPSGSGKTLILDMLAGILKPDSGRIMLAGTEVTHARTRDRGMGLVYQDRALFPHLSVRANLAYGRQPGQPAPTGARVDEVAHDVGITHLLDRRPGTLSGGEAQRVALGRALVPGPRCLLLDEPLASLDVQARVEMRSLLRGLHRRGQTLLHVTHDGEEARALATRVAIIEHGIITQCGTPDAVFDAPATAFAARFAGVRNVFHGMLGPASAGSPRQFQGEGLSCAVTCQAPQGAGSLFVRSEDVTLGTTRPVEAVNAYAGVVADVEPAGEGAYHVRVEDGLAVWGILKPQRDTPVTPPLLGARIWVTFAPGAARFCADLQETV